MSDTAAIAFFLLAAACLALAIAAWPHDDSTFVVIQAPLAPIDGCSRG